MIDENAFGVLIAIFDPEDAEYSLENAAFLDFLGRFARAIETRLGEQPLAEGLRRLDLGHAQYLEFADGDQSVDPIVWVRQTRQRLIDADLPNLCVLAAGGRWIDSPATDEAPTGTSSEYSVTVGPSEPLRKALAAEAFAQPTTSAETDDSWGPGLYVEKDAIEQLGKSLKNTPTALPVLSTLFYRIGA
ncbi:MAG TPA: hypothetical protein VIV60_11980 [Polyangiaceae bacterium]